MRKKKKMKRYKKIIEIKIEKREVKKKKEKKKKEETMMK